MPSEIHSEREQATITRSQTRAFWIAALASCLSVLVSVSSLWLSGRNYLETKASQRDSLICSVDFSPESYETAIEKQSFGDPGLISLRWVASIINTGKHPVTILSARAFLFRNETSLGAATITSILNEAGEISLPITLQPGEKRKVSFEVLHSVDLETYRSLENKVPFERKIKIGEIEEVLYSTGRDILGHKITEVTDKNGKAVSWVLWSSAKAQRFRICLRTTSNQEFQADSEGVFSAEHSYFRLQSRLDKPLRASIHFNNDEKTMDVELKPIP